MALTRSPLIISLTITSLSLSIATNAVTTLLIAYKLWYICRCRRDSLYPVADRDAKFQELPYIHREDSQLE